MSRILDGSVPTLMMLERSEDWEIRSLTAIHHLFLTPGVVEQRRPLSLTARRAGWVGCNIRLDRIAEDAQIGVIESGRPAEPKLVREAFRRFGGLGDINPRMRGWTTLTLQVIRNLRADAFTLRDLYGKENAFSCVYPENKNVRAKIRQQLQILRNLGYVEFSGNGAYRLLIGPTVGR